MFKKLLGSNPGVMIILISAAVVGGAFACIVFKSQVWPTPTNADLKVQDLRVIRKGDSGDAPNTYLSVMIKNTGTQELDEADITIDPDGADVTLHLSEIGLPGQAAGLKTKRTTNRLNAGQTYPVRIVAKTPDGGSITKTTTVRVSKDNNIPWLLGK